MKIYHFPSGEVIVDTDKWMWADNKYEWNKYVKEKWKKDNIKYEHEEAEKFSYEDVPF